MAKRQAKQRITYHTSSATDPIALEKWRRVRRLLARVIAQAYAHDHPELFGRPDGSGRPAAAPSPQRDDQNTR